MLSYVTFTYLASLVAFTGLIYFLFFVYGKMAGRYSPLLSGLDGGFVSFLAINEVVALPFLLFHLSFKLFFVIFLVLNTSIFLYGLVCVLKSRISTPRFKIKAPSPYLILAGMILLFTVSLTQFYVKYDADDSFYVSLVQQNKDNPNLYSSDPSTGNKNLEFPSAYIFEGWELVESSLASVFRLSSLEFTHGLVPIMVIPLVFIAHRRIFKYLTGSNKSSYIGLSLLGIMLIFSGYSLYSQGTFLLSRSWQGKAIISVFIIPLLLFALSKIYEYPKRLEFYFGIFAINIAAIALNPSAIYICFAATFAFVFLLLIKSRVSAAVKLLLTLSPIMIMGIATFIARVAQGSGDFDGGGTASYFEFVRRFVGNSWYFYIGLIGLLVFLKTKVMKKGRVLLYLFPIILLLTFLNPIFFPLIKNYAASNTYWRLFWLVPLTILVPLVGAQALGWLSEQARRFNPYCRVVIISMALTVLALVFIASGHFIFDTSKPLVAYDNTRQKVPSGVPDVSFYLSEVPNGKVLAPTDPAAYLHTFTIKHELVVSRKLSISYSYGKNTQENREVSNMFNIVNDITTNSSLIYFHQLLEKYQVKYVVYHTNNPFMDRFSDAYGIPLLHRNEIYSIINVP